MYVLKYFRHRLLATNRHGAHSPFIYRYLTECIYLKKRYSASNTLNVLLKSISYFQVRSISIDLDTNNLKNDILGNFPKIEFEKAPFDLIFMNDMGINTGQNLLKRNDFHNDSIIIVNDIYKNKQKQTAWEHLKKKPQVTVSIDFFYCGLVFFRKEQTKEHFRFRL